MRRATTRPFSPGSMSAVPSTVSPPSRVAAPVRGRAPAGFTVATSLSNTGSAPQPSLTVSPPISSGVCARTNERIVASAGPRSTSAPAPGAALRARVLTRSPTSNPFSASLGTLGSTTNSRLKPPVVFTSANPGTARTAGRTTKS